MQRRDLLVDDRAHLISALFHEGGALLEVVRSDRVGGGHRRLARRRGVADVHDRPVRVTRHLKVVTQLARCDAAAELGSSGIQDNRRLGDPLLGGHVGRVRQRRPHRGSRCRRRGGDRHRDGRGVGDRHGECGGDTHDQAGHGSYDNRLPAARQRVAQDLLAAGGRRSKNHDCSPWR